MPGTPEDGSSKSRLDRLEGLMALLIENHVQFREEHRQLLTAQVMLADRVDKLAGTLDTAIKELAASQRHTDDRLNELISIVGGVIRKRPDQPN
jgi:hypothetical protein